MPSKPLSGEQLSQHWALEENVWGQSKRPELVVSKTQLPTRWTIRQHPSLIWSTVSIVRAVDRLKEGTDEIEFSVSPDHAEFLAEMIQRVHEMFSEFAELSDPSRSTDAKVWAEHMAKALIQVEMISRAIHPDAVSKDSQAGMGMAAEPLFQMISGLLDEDSQGDLLGGLSVSERTNMREVLMQLILRGGFALGGFEQPADLRQQVETMFKETPDPSGLEKKLKRLLAKSLRDATPASGERALHEAFRKAMAFGPRLLNVMHSLVLQWDRVDYVELELRRYGKRPVVGFRAKILDGHEVRIANQFIMQPPIVVRGMGQIVVQPSIFEEGQTSVLFAADPQQGAVEIRFQGIGFGLVKLFAIPIDSAALREIRISRQTGHRGDRFINVLMFMETTKTKGDPRRMFAVQRVQHLESERTAFRVWQQSVKEDLSVSYLKPGRIYSYKRTKAAKE